MRLVNVGACPPATIIRVVFMEVEIRDFGASCNSANSAGVLSWPMVIGLLADPFEESRGSKASMVLRQLCARSVCPFPD
jgi:hypothetical protein